MNCTLLVTAPPDKLLFADDGFSPVIPVAADQCWVGFAIEGNLSLCLGATVDGFGVSLKGVSHGGLSTYSRFEATPDWPLLKSAIEGAVENFCVTFSADSIRQQPANTVNVSELSGTVTFTGSYEIPLAAGAFATVNLPFNSKIAVAPDGIVEIQGALAVSGEFLVRSYKLSENIVRFGLYKQKGTTLTASISANADIDANVGGTDLLGLLLNAVLPGVDVAKSGIDAQNAKALNSVIKDTLDHRIGVELNARCAASMAHEAAVLYEIHLEDGDAQKTGDALKAALSGDWTLLATLPNASRLRDVVADTREQKLVLSLNLLGIYSAASVTDYVSNCTILRDELGHLTIIDKADASRIAESATPYSADADKLRHALAQDFMVTATYVAAGARSSPSLSVVQTYFDYEESMSSSQLGANVRLGTNLGVVPPGTFDSVLAKNLPVAHGRVSLVLRFESAEVMSIFFSDTTRLTPRSSEELERVGRTVLAALLDPSDGIDAARMEILNNDGAWEAMDDNGNVANFGTIPSLRRLNSNQLEDVSADWVGIRWWADTVSKAGPAIVNLNAAWDGQSPDPTSNPEFMKRRAELNDVLKGVVQDTKSAFTGTWGPAVIAALIGKRGKIQMDFAWDGNIQHFEK
ncbi:MAG TPA: hypothetical protein VGL00_13410 [Terracidiphilus sp.]